MVGFSRVAIDEVNTHLDYIKEYRSCTHQFLLFSLFFKPDLAAGASLTSLAWVRGGRRGTSLSGISPTDLGRLFGV